MNRINVKIINNTLNDKIYISLDDGEYQTIEANRILRQLLKIILNPERYDIEIAEH